MACVCFWHHYKIKLSKTPINIKTVEDLAPPKNKETSKQSNKQTNKQTNIKTKKQTKQS